MCKHYNNEGMRMTDCCGACSTYNEHGVLYCKACFTEVSPGEGDGSECKMPGVFVLRVLGKRGGYVSGFEPKGLLLVTQNRFGSLVHPTMRKFVGERCNAALQYTTEAEAEAAVRQYRATKLPRGKKHCPLMIVEVH